MMRIRGFRLTLASIGFVTAVLLNLIPVSKGSDEEKTTISQLTGRVVKVLTEQQERDLIKQMRFEHEILVGRVAGRLREIQGISSRFSTDVRLSGVPVIVNGLTGEFESPTRISLVEEEWITLAGEIHASECSNLLLNRITELREVVPINARSLVPDSFTFHALCQIGEPACRDAFKRLPLESDARRRKLFVSLLQAVRGNSKVKSDLARLLNATNDDAERDRIELAIKQVEADLAKETK